MKIFLRRVFKDYFIIAVIAVLFAATLSVIGIFSYASVYVEKSGSASGNVSALQLYNPAMQEIDAAEPAEEYLLPETDSIIRTDSYASTFVLVGKWSNKLWVGTIKNPFFQDYRDAVKLTVKRRPLFRDAVISIQGMRFVLPVNNWSDDITVEFQTPYNKTAHGTLRLRLDAVTPDVRLSRSQLQFSYDDIYRDLLDENDWTESEAIAIIRMLNSDEVSVNLPPNSISSGEECYIHIRIPENKLYFMRWNSRLKQYVTVRRYTVSPGRPSLQTPIGKGIIYHKGPVHFIKRTGPDAGEIATMAARFPGDTEKGPIPYEVIRGFYMDIRGMQEYVIHSTTEWWNMGKCVSHGCVRVRIKDMLELYPLVPENIPVYIEYETIDVQDGKIYVYADVYERGTNTPAHALVRLRQAGHPIELIDREKLIAFLNDPRQGIIEVKELFRDDAQISVSTPVPSAP